MPRFLNRSPFSDMPSELSFRDERIRIRADQMIVWMSITIERITSPNPSATPFPVILDTGHNHSFSMHEDHLLRWAGLRIESLARLSAVRDRGQRIPLRAANLWCYPNVAGMRDQLEECPPLRVSAPIEIAIYSGAIFPRLPILGLRAIAENRLILKVNGPRREATLRTPFFGW